MPHVQDFQDRTKDSRTKLASYEQTLAALTKQKQALELEVLPIREEYGKLSGSSLLDSCKRPLTTLSHHLTPSHV